MKYMMKVVSNNYTMPWIEIEAYSLHSAKMQATNRLNYGYSGEQIRLVEVGYTPERVNDLPCWVRPVGKGGRWLESIHIANLIVRLKGA